VERNGESDMSEIILDIIKGLTVGFIFFIMIVGYAATEKDETFGAGIFMMIVAIILMIAVTGGF